MYIKKTLNKKKLNKLSKKKNGGFFSLFKSKKKKNKKKELSFKDYKQIFIYFIKDNRTNVNKLIKLYKKLDIKNNYDYNHIIKLLENKQFFNKIKETLLKTYKVKYISYNDKSSLCNSYNLNDIIDINSIRIKIRDFCDFITDINNRINKKKSKSLKKIEDFNDKINKSKKIDNNEKNILIDLIESILYYINTTYSDLRKIKKTNSRKNNFLNIRELNKNIIHTNNGIELSVNISPQVDIRLLPNYILPDKIGIGYFINPTYYCGELGYLNENNKLLNIRSTIYTDIELNIIQNLMLTIGEEKTLSKFFDNRNKPIYGKHSRKHKIDYKTATPNDYSNCWGLEYIPISNNQDEIINGDEYPNSSSSTNKSYYGVNDNKNYMCNLFMSAIPVIERPSSRDFLYKSYNENIDNNCKEKRSSSSSSLYRKSIKMSLRSMFDAMIIKKITIPIISIYDKYITQKCDYYNNVEEIIDIVLNETIYDSSTTNEQYKRCQFFKEIYYSKPFKSTFEYKGGIGPSRIQYNNTTYMNNYINQIRKFKENKLKLVVKSEDYSIYREKRTINTTLRELISKKIIVPISSSIYNNKKKTDLYRDGIKGGICSMGFDVFSKLKSHKGFYPYTESNFKKNKYRPYLDDCYGINTQFLKNIIKHINKRFDFLIKLLETNNQLKIVIPSNIDYLFLPSGYYYKTNNTDPIEKHKYIGCFGHLLGNHFDKKRWKINEETNLKVWKIVMQHFDLRIFDLYQRYPNKINSSNSIGDSISNTNLKPNENCIHIFPANCNNWNTEFGKKIAGEGLAQHLKTGKKGLFGIITSPNKYDINQNILETDKIYGSI